MTITIFMFHEVKDPPFEYPIRYEKHSFLRLSTFKERIEYIRRNYRIVSLRDIDTCNRSENNAVLTFDDGTTDHYSTVFPYLRDLNIPASFFVPSTCIEQKGLIPSHAIQYILASKPPADIVQEIKHRVDCKNFDEIYNEYSKSLYKNNTWTPDEIFVTRFLRSGIDFDTRLELYDALCPHLNERLYMTMEEVREIASDPLMTIGSHGALSWNLCDVPKNVCIHEIKKSSDLLDDLGVTEKFFSYPNGGFNDEIIKCLQSFGYTKAVTTRKCADFSNPMTLPRQDGSNFTFGRPKIVLCGVQQQGIDILMFLRNHNIQVTHVVTIDEKEALRQKSSGWIDYTSQLPPDIEVHHAKHYGLKIEQDFEYFHKNRFDILILGGWQRLIPSRILNIVKYGGIGQHGSSEFLPRYRGRSPINWSIILNRKRIVWHLFRMRAGVDDGEILDYEIFEINEWDDVKTIYHKVAITVKYMLLRTIPLLIEEKCKPSKQVGEPTFYGKRTPSDGMIDWNSSMYEIYNLVRGVTDPYPGAFTYKENKKIMIWKVQPFSAYLPYYTDRSFGEIVEVFEDSSYLVKAEEGTLLVTKSDDSNPKIGDVYLKR